MKASFVLAYHIQ